VSWWLLALGPVAVGFVFICGANDGGALLALAVRHRDVPAYGMLALLMTALVLGPGLFGLDVARTYTDRLVVGGPGELAQPIMLAGVSVTIAVVVGLTRRGVPTSITLAVLGGLSGVALGLGLAPAWWRLGAVLMLAAVAPLVGGALGFLLGMLARRLPTFSRLTAAVRLAHLTAFGGQALAYAANDGQKMFAVLAVAGAGAAGEVRPPSLLLLAGVAVVFAAGAVVSFRRMSSGPTFGLLRSRPWHLVSAEVASSGAVLGSAALGVPVSMTQSVAAGLVGAGASQGLRRVRWQYAVPVLISWLVTLPVSFGVGTLVGLAMGAVL
jgi:PiT family inorganic phosphate transporter